MIRPGIQWAVAIGLILTSIIAAVNAAMLLVWAGNAAQVPGKVVTSQLDYMSRSWGHYNVTIGYEFSGSPYAYSDEIKRRRNGGDPQVGEGVRLLVDRAVPSDAGLREEVHRDIAASGVGALCAALIGGLMIAFRLRASMRTHARLWLANTRTRRCALALGGAILVDGLLLELPPWLMAAILLVALARFVQIWFAPPMEPAIARINRAAIRKSKR